MTFRKPFRAVPIKPSPLFMKKQRARARARMIRLGLIAGAVGLLGGVTSVAVTADGRAQIGGLVHPVGVRLGLVRARAPQVGDYWEGCDSARAAGSAPIYRGEPGYRAEMDGDYDGVACEPYHGG